jgi:hypothetical protein
MKFVFQFMCQAYWNYFKIEYASFHFCQNSRFKTNIWQPFFNSVDFLIMPILYKICDKIFKLEGPISEYPVIWNTSLSTCPNYICTDFVLTLYLRIIKIYGVLKNNQNQGHPNNKNNNNFMRTVKLKIRFFRLSERKWRWKILTFWPIISSIKYIIHNKFKKLWKQNPQKVLGQRLAWTKDRMHWKFGTFYCSEPSKGCSHCWDDPVVIASQWLCDHQDFIL